MTNPVKQWLANPKRTYASGIALFEQLAGPEIREKYLGYFKAVQEPAPFDVHFSMLVNKMTDIDRKVSLHPESFPILFPATPPDPLKSQETRRIRTEDLPPALQTEFEQIRRITPLMASIHADLSDPSLSDKDRKLKAEELCNLEDERRSKWELIDHWAESKEVTLSTGQPHVDDDKADPLSAGIRIGRRINRLKENILRSEKAAETAGQKGKLNLKASAEARVAAYKKELTELEHAANGEKTV